MIKKLLLMPFLLILLSLSIFAVSEGDPDLMGLWHLDETSGNLLDTKTNGRVALDMVYPLGDYEEPPLFNFSINSVGFDGSQNSASTRGVISTADAAGTGTIFFNKTTGFTVGAGTNLSSIGDRGVMGSNDGGSRGWQMRHSGDPNVFCRWFDPTGGSHLALVAGAFFNTRVACIFNVTGVYMYLNGTLRASDTSGIDIHHGDANFSIGSLGDKLGSYATPFLGDIDEAYFINRSLTPAEIVDIDTNGFSSTDQPIINSSWNVTSDVFTNAIRTNWNNGDQVNFSVNTIDQAIVSLTVNTSVASNMSCSLTENNYSGMIALDPLSKSATTETTGHSYTLSDNFTSEGQDCVFCSFIQSDGSESSGGLSDSGCLDVFINTQPINNSFPTPPTDTTVSGLTLIDWDAFTDVNLHTYEVFLTTPIPPTAFKDDVNATHLYRFEEGSGVFANDSIGSDDGAIFGAVHSVSKGGNSTGDFSIFCDGFNDDVVIDNAVGLFDKDDPFSYSFWFKTNMVGTAYMLNKQFQPGDGWDGYGIFISVGKLSFFMGDSGSNLLLYEATNDTFNDDVWHFAVATYDGSLNATGMRWFIDGVEVGTTVLQNNMGGTVLNSADLTICSRQTVDNFYDGFIDEVGVYRTNLTADNITILFESGLLNTSGGFDTIFIGNTTSPTTQLNFNFSTIPININYTVNVRGYDDFDSTGLGFNSFIFNELFIPPLPAGFFNVTLISPNDISLTDSDLPINFTWNINIDSNESVNSSCFLYIDSDIVENFTVNSSGNISNFFSVDIVNASYIWNITCDMGIALNAPFNFTFVVTPVDDLAVGDLFAVGNCPDDLVSAILYIFFFMLFIGLTVWGLFYVRILTSLGSLGLFFMSLSVLSCVGFVLGILMVLISVCFGMWSVWDLIDLSGRGNG